MIKLTDEEIAFIIDTLEDEIEAAKSFDNWVQYKTSPQAVELCKRIVEKLKGVK